MPALDPAQPVCPLEAVSDERAAQVVARAEKSAHAVRLDHGTVLILLLVDRHPQVLPVRYSWGRSTFGELPYIAEVKIVQQSGAECVGQADVGILNARARPVGVAGVVVWVEVRRVLELIDEIPSRQPVILADLVVHSHDALIQVLSDA